jgi:hypothetical protein
MGRIPLTFGQEKITIRIIFALEYSCTKGVLGSHKTPDLLAKHCHVKLLYIPKTFVELVVHIYPTTTTLCMQRQHCIISAKRSIVACARWLLYILVD